jgi:hypothetical protein
MLGFLQLVSFADRIIGSPACFPESAHSRVKRRRITPQVLSEYGGKTQGTIINPESMFIERSLVYTAVGSSEPSLLPLL